MRRQEVSSLVNVGWKFSIEASSTSGFVTVIVCRNDDSHKYNLERSLAA